MSEGIGRHPAACCNIPPIVAEGYTPKGSYKDIGGFKTYVTGSPTAKKAILYIFDIFGFYPQSLQGADILASTSKHSDYLVLMPDFFHNDPADISWFPPQTDEHKAKLGAFFEAQGAPPKTVSAIPKLLDDIESQHKDVKEWGVVGFCWGGKVTSLVAGKGEKRIKAVAECHPAFLDKGDAEKIKVPVCVLASKDEDKGDVEAFEKALTGEKHVEIFGDQIHGWMAARSDLKDEKVKKEYERGYKTLVEFFGQHLGGEQSSKL